MRALTTAGKQHDDWKTISERPERESRRKTQGNCRGQRAGATTHASGYRCACLNYEQHQGVGCRARVSAATALLDRGYGKAPQHIDAEVGSYVALLPRPYDTAEEWEAAVKLEMAMKQRPKLDAQEPDASHLLEAKDLSDD